MTDEPALPPDHKREDTLDSSYRYLHAKVQQVADEVGYDWMEDARCVGEDPELWQPDKDQSLARVAMTTEAVDLCFNECPVRLQCLKAACIVREPTGIWGGLGISIRRGEKHKVAAHDYDFLSQVPNPNGVAESESQTP